VRKIIFLYKYSDYYKLVDERDKLMGKLQKLLVKKNDLDEAGEECSIVNNKIKKAEKAFEAKEKEVISKRVEYT
jgi:hypothetical protein